MANPTNPKQTELGQWFASMGLNIRGSNEEAILRRMLIGMLWPQLQDSAELGGQLQQKIPGLLTRALPGSGQAIVQKASNMAFSHAARAAKQANAMARSQGLGAGFQGGINESAFNEAARASNEAQRFVSSPEFAQQSLGLIQGAMQPTNAPLVGSLIGSQPFVKPQESPSVLGGIIQGLAGAYGQKLGSKI